MISSRPKRRQNGSIGVLFCLLIAIVIGTVSYSLYMGYHVEQKIALYNASDTGALAAGGHVSQGLNMMAANNLTIGAALHVAASVPIVAAYASFAYAFTSNIATVVEDAVKQWGSQLTGGVAKFLDRYQKKIWNPLANVTAFFIRIAAGLTGFNEFLANYWLIPAPLRAVEMTRMDHPNTVVLPLQSSMLGSQNRFLGYSGLRTSSAKQAMCRTLNRSEGIDGRGDFWTWLSGPLQTLGGEVKSVSDTFDKVTKFAEKYLPMTITYVDCGYGVESSILHLFQNLARNMTKDFVAKNQMTIKAADKVVSIADSKAKPSGELCKVLRSVRVTFSKLKTTVENVGKAKLAAQYAYHLMLYEWRKNVRQYPAEPRVESYSCDRDGLGRWVSGPLRWKHARVNFRKVFPTKWHCERGRDQHFNSMYRYWQKKRSPYHCTDKSGAVRWDHIEHSNASGCLNLRHMDPDCALEEFVKPGDISVSIGSCVDNVRDKVRRWKHGCRHDFDHHGDPENQRPGKFQIVDWGEQLDAYINGGSMSLLGQEINWGGKAVDNQLGFIYIADHNAFDASTYFLIIAANAGRLAQEECPAELVYEENEQTFCAIPSMRGMAEWYVAADSAEDSAAQRRLQMRHVSAGAEQLWLEEAGALATSWQRAQWVVSGAKVGKKTPRRSRQLDLFWPDWFPRLHRPEWQAFHASVSKIGKPLEADALSRLYR